ncbi:hypothetical protein [Noviherbaspirillum autotrophicum]|uniref:Uncharacterized protein n=1 Tax=Noviherbaspirillum autotrophicum TaxID=709839 RepID=A0A0C1YPB8_9BURK|nr:hypothetical protein [Noviherbaspirillum autotrophicum]KIF82412.1 hypothetical protein TSA66_18885 [Noviherbaspirillum autotrophicum]
MVMPQKDYFTFTDLENRWGLNRDALHLLVINEELVPSYFLRLYQARSVCFEKDESGAWCESLFGSDDCVERRFVFLRAPVRAAANSCVFKYGCDSQNAELGENNVGQWVRFMREITLDDPEVVFQRLEIEKFEGKNAHLIKPDDALGGEKQISGKSETAYLHIIGALCDLYWREKHSGSARINQSEIIADLEKYIGFSGLSERNLKDKLSRAIKAICNE